MKKIFYTLTLIFVCLSCLNLEAWSRGGYYRYNRPWRGSIRRNVIRRPVVRYPRRYRRVVYPGYYEGTGVYFGGPGLSLGFNF